MVNRRYDSLPIDTLFNKDLVNSLPGIFYLYEVADDNAYLKRWNTKHEVVTERTSDELYNEELLNFIAEDSRKAVSEKVQYLITEGHVKNVYGNVLTKSGNTIPYVFEGYRFTIDDKIYFMGMGMDISDLVSARDQIKVLEFQKRKKEKELLSIAFQEQQKEDLLKRVLLKLEEIESNVLNKSNTKSIKSLTQEIKTHFSFNDHWEVFKSMFTEIHYDFFKQLKCKHPNLTRGDLQYCAYLKMQMHATEICSIMNISKEGLAKKRYRLKKKLDLDKEQNLDVYITSF